MNVAEPFPQGRSRAELNRGLRLNRPGQAPSCYGCGGPARSPTGIRRSSTRLSHRATGPWWTRSDSNRRSVARRIKSPGPWTARPRVRGEPGRI